MVAKSADSNERPAKAASAGIELVDQARAGDPVAFHRLVDHYQPEIFRMIFYRTRSQMDAEDICQDVFLQAHKNLGRLKSPAVFRSWLYQIAVNRVRDYYRKKKFKSLFAFVSVDEEYFHETAEMAIAPEAGGGLERRDFWRQIKALMATLSRMEREVFMLRFFDQLSIKEISAALKKNESTVKTHLYRALRKVKAAAAETGELLEGRI